MAPHLKKMRINIFIVIIIFFLLTITSEAGDIVGTNSNYIVKRGDTVKKISSRYGISSNHLLRTNKIINPDIIRPGQSLKISTQKIIPKKVYNGLVINLPEYEIYYFKNGTLVDTYHIAIGKYSWRTPRGRFFVDNKALNPTWRIPPKMQKKYRHKYKTKTIPPGPNNPLGKYWIGLSLPHIGIHSTTQPYSIGQARSHGCMRLNIRDAERLFNSVDVGTQGEIIYEPIKIGNQNGNIFIEVHKDIYNLKNDLYSDVVRKLKKKNLYDKVDLKVVKKAVSDKEGIPIVISKNSRQIFKEPLNENIKVKKSSSTQLWNNLSID
ncbi:MAG: L,D-transpeptidase family protein [Thermodesulfobacteriota bacterium]